MLREDENASSEALVSERDKQASDAVGQRWPWVERSVWTDRMLAALESGVQGQKWFSLYDKVCRGSTLLLAWEKVRRNKGSAGIDGQSLEMFERFAPKYLAELEEALKSGLYRPEAVRRVFIPKGKGQARPLGIPCVKDRIVQTALKLVCEPIFEREFKQSSYGFRPRRGCKDALRQVQAHLNDGYHFVVDADLKGYFDSIPHEGMLSRVAERISDGKVLSLINSFIKQDIVHEVESWTPIAGTPQGAVISPLLANLYLHPLDCLMAEQGYRMVRYADDFVILCRTLEEAQTALSEVRRWVEGNGLTLHPDKTHVGDCRETGQGFEFLGYRFEAGRRHVRKKSKMALKDKVRGWTKRTNGTSLETIISKLNPTLRGWFGYFKHAHEWDMESMDGFIRRRLRSLLRTREKRSGFGRCLNDHTRWPNKYFAELGLFTLTTARASASQSRC